MYELKPLSASAIPAALAKAERYRLLNEGSEAESICLDILAVDPDNQEALTMLILAVTDQFREDGGAAHAARAEQMLPRLHDEYARAYYGALIRERRARAYWSHGRASLAHEWLLEALHGFEHAIALRPAGNDDAILRWNACVRLLRGIPEPARAHDHREPAITSE
jgi:hypothetical protein